MSILLSIFFNNLLPVFIVIGAGILLGITLQPDVKAISRTTFYALTPCLIFSGLTSTPLTGAEAMNSSVRNDLRPSVTCHHPNHAVHGRLLARQGSGGVRVGRTPAPDCANLTAIPFVCYPRSCKYAHPTIVPTAISGYLRSSCPGARCPVVAPGPY